jgi:hypothetical protein
MPRQRKIQYRINRLLVQSIAGFNCPDWVWELSPVDISEKERMALVHERYGKLGVMTINEIRRDLGLPAVLGGDVPFIIAAPDKITLIPQLASKLEELNSAQEAAATQGTDSTAGSQQESQGTSEQNKVLNMIGSGTTQEVA